MRFSLWPGARRYDDGGARRRASPPTRMERVFSEIYARHEWGAGSGPGSLPESTREYRRVLQRLFWALRPCRVLDVGCGYFDPYAELDWKGVEYVGLDVVPAVVESNTARFAGGAVRFARCDATDRASCPAAEGF